MRLGNLRLAEVLIPGLFLTGAFVVGRLLLPGGDSVEHGPGVQEGQELIALVVGDSRCGASRDPAFASAIKSMAQVLEDSATARGATFISIGAALDSDIESGRSFLSSIGEFDEEIVGRSWLNSAAISYLWRENPGPATIPQVILIERDVTLEGATISISPDRVLSRRVGTTSIIEWVGDGVPLSPGN